jgi:hypothetical protein
MIPLALLGRKHVDLVNPKTPTNTNPPLPLAN